MANEQKVELIENIHLRGVRFTEEELQTMGNFEWGKVIQRKFPS